MTEASCSNPVASSSASHADCDVGTGDDASAVDPTLRRASSMPEDQPSASQHSPISPRRQSCQTEDSTVSRSSSSGTAAERAKRFAMKGSSVENPSTTVSGCSSPSSSVSSHCSRNDMAECPSHIGEYYVDMRYTGWSKKLVSFLDHSVCI